MARGTKGAEALDMSKFFDTNYHYLVPELAASVAPKPDFSTFIAKARARRAPARRRPRSIAPRRA
jgi:5-methyltetrahydropteroyltriglutamate--homocysteine methyltransferase